MEERARRALQTALPAYELEGELGRGAFGVVYAARHTQLGRNVAVKVLPQAFAADDAVRGRFVAEAQMVASLDHPHIVPVYDYVEHEDACMLIMERCDSSVGDRFKEQGIATDEACAAILSCLAALDLAHERGVLHRDVKPENLMHDMKGVVKLADFGIARALDNDIRRTKTGMVVGTPAYMSPEQVRGDELTAASDVYSVAMMAYELLTGTLPFPSTPSVNGLLAHHLVTEPLPMLSSRPELPGSIGSVVDRALSKSLDDRHATALELANDLSAACVRAFGTGWLRRRNFTLHWPDIVAENERPASGAAVGTTGTIVVQAMSSPHEVISPAQALADSEDAPTAQRTAPPVSSPPLPPGTPVPPPHPPVSSLAAVSPVAPMPAAPTSPAPPSPPTNAMPAADTGRRGPNPLVWILGAITAVLLLAVAGFFLLGSDDTGNEVQPDTTTTNDALEDDELDDGASGDEPGGADVATTVAATVAPDEGAVDEPVTDEQVDPEPDPDTTIAPDTTLPVIAPVDDPAAFSNRPDSYVARDASEFLYPTPCPEDQPKVACIHNGVSFTEETGVLNVSFFTEGFVPELEPASDHVHFYFDTTVDGDENAAGSASPVAEYRPWDLPFNIFDTTGENGRAMFTLADARAADARYLCIIVADADQVALPDTGNCAPILQSWDLDALAVQTDRVSGQFIGRCSIDVTAIVPNDWRSADLVATSPADAAAQLFPTNADIVSTFESFVANGIVLYTDGVLAGDSTANITFAVYPGAFRIGSNPAQVSEQLALLGIDTGPTANESVGSISTLTSTTDDGTTLTKRYFVADFGYVIDMAVTADSGADLTLADRVADTIVGC
ncbi:MAG: serine/threonine-protein kinase [Ilumatobacter sp.]